MSAVANRLKVGFYTQLRRLTGTRDPVFKVKSIPRDGAMGLNKGDQILIDPLNREIDYRAHFVFKIGRFTILAGLGPFGTRPADGRRELHLECLSGDTKAALPITDDEFQQCCLGRYVGRYPFKPRIQNENPSDDEGFRGFPRPVPEERAIETKRTREARRMRWRANEITANMHDWAVVKPVPRNDIRAKEGKFPVDRVIRELIDQGRLLHYHLEDDHGPFASARLIVFHSAFTAVERTSHIESRLRQGRADAVQIGKRLDRIIRDLDGFLTHVGLDKAWLIQGIGEPPPDDEPDPLEWVGMVAEDALSSARDEFRQTVISLVAVREAIRFPRYKYDGATHVLTAEFLKWMSFAFETLTNERPGRSNATFLKFCEAAWETVGWPRNQKSHFPSRIARGQHMIT